MNLNELKGGKKNFKIRNIRKINLFEFDAVNMNKNSNVSKNNSKDVLNNNSIRCVNHLDELEAESTQIKESEKSAEFTKID